MQVCKQQNKYKDPDNTYVTTIGTIINDMLHMT
jgi:hypothetical protein